MALNRALLSSQNHSWETPNWLFDSLHGFFDFTVDAAANSENKKLQRHWSVLNSGLEHSWQGERVWCNPPYGRDLTHWVQKAHTEWKAGANAVLLIPARPDTIYWHKYLLGEPDLGILWLKGRLSFELQGKSVDPATFPSVLLMFLSDPVLKEQSREKFGSLGFFR